MRKTVEAVRVGERLLVTEPTRTEADLVRTPTEKEQYAMTQSYQPGTGGSPSEPGRSGQVTVGSYGSYAAAERAVDFLSDQHFPVERTAIVGRGLTSVEQVTGRLTMWRAAAQAALSGAILGALLGWLFGLFNWVDPLVSSLLLALYGALIGAALGAMFGLLAHGLTGGRRDFSSVSGLQATSYDILVDAEVADEARRLLQSSDLPGAGWSSGVPG